MRKFPSIIGASGTGVVDFAGRVSCIAKTPVGESLAGEYETTQDATAYLDTRGFPGGLGQWQSISTRSSCGVGYG